MTRSTHHHHHTPPPPHITTTTHLAHNHTIRLRDSSMWTSLICPPAWHTEKAAPPRPRLAKHSPGTPLKPTTHTHPRLAFITSHTHINNLHKTHHLFYLPILPQVGDLLPFWTILSTELLTAEHRHTLSGISFLRGGGGEGGEGGGVTAWLGRARVEGSLHSWGGNSTL